MINNGVILSELHIKELNFIVCKDRKISTIKKTRTKYISIELKDFYLYTSLSSFLSTTKTAATHKMLLRFIICFIRLSTNR